MTGHKAREINKGRSFMLRHGRSPLLCTCGAIEVFKVNELFITCNNMDELHKYCAKQKCTCHIKVQKLAELIDGARSQDNGFGRR